MDIPDHWHKARAADASAPKCEGHANHYKCQIPEELQMLRLCFSFRRGVVISDRAIRVLPRLTDGGEMQMNKATRRILLLLMVLAVLPLAGCEAFAQGLYYGLGGNQPAY